MTIDLRLGDCLEVMKTLPDGCVDAIITDPVWPNAPDGMFPGIGDAEVLLGKSLRLVEAKRVVIVMRNDSDPRFLQAVSRRWPFFKACWLPYVIPGYIGRKLGGDEIAYCFGAPTPSAPGRRLIPTRGPAVQPDGRIANGHPCSRALRHFEWLVHWWSMPGETVLDPFMGSGTTGLACLKLGRNFIGIEIDPGYFEIAKKRIEEAQLQMMLPFKAADHAE